ncbi:argininosuccinate lyase [Gordonibacter sp. 28C]|uniref:ribbon-helix-helix domain-containing protein n=1 Tax=Gordonibacter sp. 28C TaxID=2078569 RepID=UPI000DF802D6|nr:argininosuccinate lyase [Gordonibacter sp. 28C]RDB61513.1 argininosuccinate lyase [Gordonibacter sp. 28C]
MPALQVREFPDDLYEQLKAYAASQHRSIAQQTIVAVEQMLEAANASHYWDGRELHRVTSGPRCLDFDTEAKRAARIEKRKELFARMDEIVWKGAKPTGDEIVAMVQEGREERDRMFGELMPLAAGGDGR